MTFWITLTLLVLCTLWVKPWQREISARKLLILLFIDALSFGSFFSLNFYKIYAIFRVPILCRNFKKQHWILILLFLLIPLLSGFLFLSLSNEQVIWDRSVSFFDSNIFRILRNQFTLLTTFLFGYELYSTLKNDEYNKFFQELIFVGNLILVGILIEITFKLDLYALMSGGKELLYSVDHDRVRGLLFEPRGAALALCLSLIANLLLNNKKSFWLVMPLIVGAFLLAKSMAGVITFVVLISLLTIHFLYKKNWYGFIKILSVLGVFSVLTYVISQYSDFGRHIQDRAFVYQQAPSQRNSDHSLYFKVISKFEVHESSYLNFLGHNPVYFLTGTGSGLSGVASEKYVLEKDKITFPNGSKSLPLMGAIYLLGQYGVFSFLFFLVVIYQLKTWQPAGKVMFNLVLVAAGIQFFYLFPFVVCASLLFLSKVTKESSLKVS